MKIAVINVCYNSEGTIMRILGSFLARTHPDKEVIVIEGSSKKDAAAALLKALVARSYASLVSPTRASTAP